MAREILEVSESATAVYRIDMAQVCAVRRVQETGRGQSQASYAEVHLAGGQTVRLAAAAAEEVWAAFPAARQGGSRPR
jgi:hypothetical protein